MSAANEYRDKSAKTIDRDKVREIFEKSRQLLDEVGYQLLKREVIHNEKPLKTTSIKTPKLLINIIKIQAQTVKIQQGQ